MRRAWRWLLIAAWLAGNVWLWTILPPAPRLTLPGRATVGLAFTPDGRQVLTADEDVLQVWDTTDGRLLRSCPQADGRPIREPVLSPDGRWVMGGAWSHEHALLLDLADGRIVRHDFLARLPPRFPTDYAFSPDGRTAAWPIGGSRNGPPRVVLWDLQAGAERASLPAVQGPLAFTPDSQTLAARDYTAEPVIRFWDTATGRPGAGSCPVKRPINYLAFGPDGRRLLISEVQGEGEVARVWDVAAGQFLFEVPAQAAWLPNGDLVMPVPGGTEGLHFTVLDGATGATRCEWVARMPHGGVGLLFDPSQGIDGRAVLTKTYYDLAAWAAWLAPRLPTALKDRLRLGEQPVAIGWWDPLTGRPVFNLVLRSSRARDLITVPDGHTLATMEANGTVTLWDVPLAKPWRLLLPLLGGQAMLAGVVVLWRRRRARAAAAGG
jgi:WD40 repeat protein